jgi:competence protein ComEC
MDFLYKAPFVRMLAMLLAGILLQSYFDFSGYVFPVFVSGVSLIMVSFLMSPKRRFSLRPLFGVGIALTLIAIGVFSTSIRQMQSRYLFSGQPKSYIGVVSEVPQQKPRSIACKLQLDDLQNRDPTFSQHG